MTVGARASRPPSAELIEFLRPFPPQVIELALATRARIIALAPRANETVWDAYNAVSIGFAYKESFLHIAVYAKHVNIGFNRGTELPDPKKVLAGSGKLIRHITLRTLDDLKQPYIPTYVKAAIRLAGGAVKQEPQLTIRRMNSGRRRPNA
jgi:hypothetical protein